MIWEGAKKTMLCMVRYIGRIGKGTRTVEANYIY